MQKAHSNINWENLPSKNTPLGAYLLNKQDREIDVIDDRVLALYGYQDRVAQSEKNAKTSETNAKLSETNAKNSETLAKEYMENAFAGTPEGYEQLVEDVRLMDIQTTTEQTLANSKAGGYKLVSMSGNSVQKTTTGVQLANLPDVETQTVAGITWSCKNGVVTAKGTANGNSSTQSIGIYYDMPIVAGTYFISGNGGHAWAYVHIKKSDGTAIYPCNTAFALDGTEQQARVFLQVNSGNTVDAVCYPMLNYGTTALSWEQYTGGIASPNPSYPQAIHNTFDCVEMIQGTYDMSSGAFTSSAYGICSKNIIPCNVGETIEITTENAKGYRLLFLNDNTIVSAHSSGNEQLTNASYTVPSGANNFKFHFYDTSEAQTYDTVGKITLAINGKQVALVKSVGENLVKFQDSTVTATTNVTVTVKDGVLTVTGTPNIESGIVFTKWGEMIDTSLLEVGVIYYPKNCNIRLTNSSGTQSYVNEFIFSEDIIKVECYVQRTVNNYVSGENIYPTLTSNRNAEFSPYEETLARVLLNEPLRESDVMSRTEVVRKRASVVFDGSNYTVTHGLVSGFPRFCIYGILNGKYVNTSSNEAFTELLVSHFVVDKKPVSSMPTSIDNTCCGFAKTSDLYIRCDSLTTVDEFIAFFAENPMTVEYELATPTIEVLDNDSQIALNSLETFDTVTYINVDSRTKPSEIVSEYGTSVVGARTIKNELRNDTLEIKYNELAVALVATESGV